MNAAKCNDESITSLAQALRRGEITAEQIAQNTLRLVRESSGILNAFTSVDEAQVLRAAKLADQELAQGVDRGPMHGIPYGLKDIYDAAGLPTSCNSRLRSGHIASADSEVAARFKAAGAVLIGKLATHEFAIGVPGPDSIYPPANNPWNTAHVTGGSSSGSGAAVGAGIVRVSTGTCTGGSIRAPSAWCGIVGLKPTYGRVSTRGVEPLSWTLDHCGPMTKSVEECAIALQIMAGHDEHDPTSSREPVPNYMSSLDSGVAGMRIGVPRAFFEKSPKLRDESRAAIESTIARLREEGAVVEDVELPVMAVFNACGRVLIAAEMYTVHRERLRTRIEEYEPRTVSRLLMGAAVTSADYLNALRLRAVLTASINEVLSSHEALLTAISLDTAPRHDAALTVRDWPLQMNMFNVTGHPAIVVPVGLSRAGLPLSVQLAGRPFEEDSLLRIARSVEKSSGWQDIQPPSWRATQPQAQVVQRT